MKNNFFKKKKLLKNKTLRPFLFALLFGFFSVQLVHAQPGSTTGGFDDEPQDVPIDGGIILLASAGAVYGVIKKNKNTTKKH